MAELNVALIMRLVDRVSSPARLAAASLGGLAREEREVADGATAAALSTDKAVGVIADLARISTAAEGATARLSASTRVTARSQTLVTAATRKATASITAAAAGARSFSAGARLATTVSLGHGRASTIAATAIATNATAVRAAGAAGQTFSAQAAIATGATTGWSGATTVSTRALGASANAADLVSRSVASLTSIHQTAASGAYRLGSAEYTLTNGLRGAGDAASTAATKMTLLERGQRMAAEATASLKTHADALQDSLTKLAMASIAIQGLDSAGHAIMDPVARSVQRDAQFQRNMTGIGILADLPDSQLSAIQANIFAQAKRLALPIDVIQQDDMAILNEGVYRGVGPLKQASSAAASLSLLSDIGGSPITGAEAGALVSTYAHALQAPAEQLERYNAVLFRASQLGGDKIGDVARFMPTVMAQMKGRAFGNFAGFTDAAAAFQIVKRVAGSDEAAGVDLQDFMANLSHRLTAKQFEKAAGVDLNAEIAKGVAAHVSPLETVINILRSKVGDDPNDPKTAGKLGAYFMNQEASQAALALLQYWKDSPQGVGFATLRRQIIAPDVVSNYQASVVRASTGPAADLQRTQNAKDQLAITTGDTLRPGTKLMTGAVTGLANLTTAAEQFGGVVSKAVVFGIAGVGVMATGVAGIGKLAMGVLAPLLIVQAVTGKMLPDLLKLGQGKAMAVMGRSAEMLNGAVGRLAPKLGLAAAEAGAMEGGLFGLAAAGIPAAIAGLSTLTGAVLASTVALLANPATWLFVAIAAGALMIVKYWRPLSAFFGGLWQGLSEGLSPLAVEFGSAFTWLKPVGAWLGAAWGWFTRLIAPVKSTTKELRGWADAGHGVGLALATVIRGAITLLASVAHSDIFRVGAQIASGLVGGVTSMVPAAVKAIGAVAGAMVDALKRRLGIHSPSRVFAELGLQTLAGLGLGLERGAPGVVHRAQQIAGRLAAAGALGALAQGSIGADALAESVHLVGLAHPVTSPDGQPAPGHRTTIARLEQHFHITVDGRGRVDHRMLARELHAHARRGLDAALHDGGDDL